MKKTIIIIVACIVLIAAVAVGIYLYRNPTNYGFNDKQIIGHTEIEIIEKYGTFTYKELDENGKTVYAEYMIADYSEGSIRKWYAIRFEDGVAVDTNIRKGEHMQNILR